MLSTSDRDFTKQLRQGDLIIQSYGSKWSIARWGGTWYDYFEVRETHPCRGLETWTMKESVEMIEIWQSKKGKYHVPSGTRNQSDPTIHQ